MARRKVKDSKRKVYLRDGGRVGPRDDARDVQGRQVDACNGAWKECARLRVYEVCRKDGWGMSINGA